MCCSQVRFIYSPLLVLAGIGEHMLMNFSLFIISVIFSPLSFFFFRSYFLVFFYLGGGVAAAAALLTLIQQKESVSYALCL